MRSDDGTELGDHDVAGLGHPFPEGRRERLGAGGGVEVLHRDVHLPPEATVACAADAVRSASRASARLEVRTRSSGRIAPSFNVRIGLIANAEPSIADADPMRPPRLRYSRVST